MPTDTTPKNKLRDPRFLRVKAEVLDRDGNKCLFCPSTDVYVWHLLHGKEPWEYPLDVYVTMCRECHEIRSEVYSKLLDRMRMHFKRTPTEQLVAWSESFLHELGANGH